MFNSPGVDKTTITFEGRPFMAMPSSEAMETQWNIVKPGHPCWNGIVKEWKKKSSRVNKQIGAFVEVNDVPRLLVIRMGTGMDAILGAWAPKN